MRKLSRRLLAAVIVLAGLYGLATAGLYWAMCQPPARFGRIMKHVPMISMAVLPFEPLWMRARAGVLNVGDEAPDFDLPLHDSTGTVRLSSYRGRKPVLLIFGSYT